MIYSKDLDIWRRNWPNFPRYQVPWGPRHLAIDSPLFFTVVSVGFSSNKSVLFSFWLPTCHYHHPRQPQPPHCQTSFVPKSKSEPNVFFPRGIAITEWSRRLSIGEFFPLDFASLSTNTLSLELLLSLLLFKCCLTACFFNLQGIIVERALL